MAAIVYKVHELRIQSRWKMGAFVAREKDWTLFSGIRDVQSKLSTAPKKNFFLTFCAMLCHRQVYVPFKIT
jgi:hypothetical protein